MKTEWIAFKDQQPENGRCIYICSKGDMLRRVEKITCFNVTMCEYVLFFTHWQYVVEPKHIDLEGKS